MITHAGKCSSHFAKETAYVTENHKIIVLHIVCLQEPATLELYRNGMYGFHLSPTVTDFSR